MQGDFIMNFKTIVSIVSLILWLLLAASCAFNILYMFGVVGSGAVRGSFMAFMVILFIVSLAGFILKHKRREEVVRLNILTPVKEIGPVYVWTLALWAITNGIVLFSGGWQLFGWQP